MSRYYWERFVDIWKKVKVLLVIICRFEALVYLGHLNLLNS